MPDARLLIVEDENIVARDLQLTLKGLGYEVLPPVATGEAALRQAEAQRPDLVLMDIALRGERDGIETAERIRERFSIPVVYLTAHADDATLERAKITGPFGYVLKPYDERELHTAIQLALYKHRTDQELLRSRQWLSVTLRSIGDGVVATDAEGRIVLMNPVAEYLTGWTESEAAGRPLEDVFRIVNETTRRAAENPVRRVLAEGTIVGLANHTVLIARDGTERPIDDSASPIRDPQGAMLGVVLVFRDVTERRRLESALTERARQLEEADRRKDEFLAMLSHELRNPLAPIRTGIDLVAAGENSEVIDLMRYQIDHLVRLVDDLLDVSRVTSDRIELHLEPAELQEIVRRAVEAAQPAMDASGLALEVSLPPAPVILEADPFRLVQVFGNLLNNAAKYTPSGGRVWLTAGRSAEGTVVVTVRDDGVGMDAELLPHIFDLFMQADRSLERSQGGLGIGLTLVRRLVELHGGRVEAHSAGPGQGSEFRVVLPVHERPPPAPGGGTPRRAAEPEAPPLAPRKVLVVDDRIASAKIMATLLQRAWGHEVMMAHDGNAALEAARQFRPDVVLLDVGLPGLNGYEVARQLRQDADFDDVLLVAVTGYGTDEDRRRGEVAGFDHFLVKPPSMEMLQEAIQKPAR